MTEEKQAKQLTAAANGKVFLLSAWRSYSYARNYTTGVLYLICLCQFISNMTWINRSPFEKRNGKSTYTNQRTATRNFKKINNLCIQTTIWAVFFLLFERNISSLLSVTIYVIYIFMRMCNRHIFKMGLFVRVVSEPTPMCLYSS